MSSRRGYGGVYNSRRPRTKLYDCNYSMGESYYKPTLDQLDRKQFGVVRSEPVQPQPQPMREEAPRHRPVSMADVDSAWADEARFQEDADREVEGMLARVRAAREVATSSAEKSFDSALSMRSAETKRRFAEKMLDTVGINGESEDSSRSTTTRSHLLRLEDPKWPAIQEQGESSAELAAKARARATRARLADLDSEMAEISERGFARDRRAAALRQVLADESDAFRISKKVTITEKRTAAY